MAEFSRGKSELINSMFFADYGSRILPSSAGRTTMCPTAHRGLVSWPEGVDLDAGILSDSAQKHFSKVSHLYSGMSRVRLPVLQ